MATRNQRLDLAGRGERKFGRRAKFPFPPVREAPTRPEPVDLCRGRITVGELSNTSVVYWSATLLAPVRPIPRGKVMRMYDCVVWGEFDSLLGKFRLWHNPEDGVLVLSAKVLAMAVVQPGYKEYQKSVIEGDTF